MKAQDPATLKVVLMLDLVARDGAGASRCRSQRQLNALALGQATIGQPLCDLTSPPIGLHGLGAEGTSETPMKVKAPALAPRLPQVAAKRADGDVRRAGTPSAPGDHGRPGFELGDRDRD